MMQCGNHVRRMKSLMTASILLAASLFAPFASADTALISNSTAPLDTNQNDYAIVSYSSWSGATHAAGQLFQTGSLYWNVSSVVLPLEGYSTSSNLTLSIYAADGTGTITSTTAVGSFTLTSTLDSASSLTNATFTAVGDVRLSPSTNYFVVLSNTSTSDSDRVWWACATDYTLNTGSVGSIPDSINNYVYKLNTGDTEAWASLTYSPQVFSVYGATSAVPEPATCAAFFGASSLLLLAFRRRKHPDSRPVVR
jgi:hypothetical protein